MLREKIQHLVEPRIHERLTADEREVFSDRFDLIEEGGELLERDLVLLMLAVRHTHDALLVARHAQMDFVVIRKVLDVQRCLRALVEYGFLVGQYAGAHSPNPGPTGTPRYSLALVRAAPGGTASNGHAPCDMVKRTARGYLPRGAPAL